MEMINEALKRRRGRGVDIAIVLGDESPLNMEKALGKEEEAEELENPQSDELGLAPEAKEESMMVKDGEGHEDAEQDKALIMEMLGKHSLLSRGKK